MNNQRKNGVTLQRTVIFARITLKFPTVLIYIKGAPCKAKVRITSTTSQKTSITATSSLYSITSVECSKIMHEYDSQTLTIAVA